MATQISAQIPPPFAAHFQALAELPTDKFKRLEASLREVPPFGSRQTIADAIVKVGEKDLDGAALAEALVSLVVQFPDLPRTDLARAISQAGELELPPDARDGLARRVESLLELEALNSIGKADDIITDHEHVFRKARILTDVRPIFGADVAAEPEAAVIVAMLRIDHSTNGRREHTYFALDQADLASLKKVVDRAITKTKSLEQFLATAGLAHYQHQEPELEDS